MSSKTVSCIILALLLLLSGCGREEGESPATEVSHPPRTAIPREEVTSVTKQIDYAVEVHPGSDSLSQQVTVKSFVDGDTVHFHVPSYVVETGVLKARFLAVNAPESTGKIEEYGKAASSYTRDKLENATDILIESDTNSWNIDSTGGRHLVWIWYKQASNEPYRNLNIELLQEGLAKANSSAQNRYGSVCMAAIDQAKQMKLGIYSGKPDPDFFYGDAIELTVKELRLNPQAYEGMKVAFEGVITLNDGGSVYIEDYDPDSGMYFGISAYYGYNLNGKGLDILSVGNRSRIVGTMQYYEAGDSYQISGLSYRQMKPDDPSNLQLISMGHQAAYAVVEPKDTVSLETEEGIKEYPLWPLLLDTTVSVQGLLVQSYSFDKDADAVTVQCSKGDFSLQIRIENVQAKQELDIPSLVGKTVDVKAVADSYQGIPQLKVFQTKNITIH